MSSENQPQPDKSTAETFDETEWLQKENGKVLEYCSRNDLGHVVIIQQDSAILPPLLVVWFVESKMKSRKYWVLTGDLPTDHLVADNAKNARDAIKHFSLKWHLKAENILLGLEQNKVNNEIENTQKKFAELLISRANGLYELTENEELWGNYPG